MKPTIIGRSVQGSSHKRSDTVRQDRFKRVQLNDGTVILAVADGHGSSACPYSDVGAKTAATVFCDVMKGIYEGSADNVEGMLTDLNREGDTRLAKKIDIEWKKRIYERHLESNRPIPEGNAQECRELVYRQYGTTLLGLLITESFCFALQLGDGDLAYVNNNGFQRIIVGDKLLGVETHSLSKIDSWKKVLTSVQRRTETEALPCVYMMSTDGFANSFASESEFQKTCVEYFELLKIHGAKAVNENLDQWLSETSKFGCGDDITLVLAYLEDEQEEAVK